MEKLKVDDPVACVPIHGLAGVWGMLAVGLFAERETDEGFSQYTGAFKGGGFHLLGVQLLACVSFAAWSLLTTAFLVSDHFTIKDFL